MGGKPNTAQEWAAHAEMLHHKGLAVLEGASSQMPSELAIAAGTCAAACFAAASSAAAISGNILALDADRLRIGS